MNIIGETGGKRIKQRTPINMEIDLVQYDDQIVEIQIRGESTTYIPLNIQDSTWFCTILLQYIRKGSQVKFFPTILAMLEAGLAGDQRKVRSAGEALLKELMNDEEITSEERTLKSGRIQHVLDGKPRGIIYPATQVTDHKAEVNCGSCHTT